MKFLCCEFNLQESYSRWVFYFAALHYTYDSMRRLTAVQIRGTQHDRDSAEELQTITYSYDPEGRLTEKTFPGGIRTTWQYDGQDGLPVSLTHEDKEGVLDRYTYAYDPMGNKTAVTRQRRGLPQESGLYAYAYDPLGRLASVAKDGAPLRGYAYDTFSNRARMTDHHKGSATAYTYDAADRLTASEETAGERRTRKTYEYDHRGNLTKELQEGVPVHSYAYNAMDRLAKAWSHTPDGAVQTETSYYYNGLGQRVGKGMYTGAAGQIMETMGQPADSMAAAVREDSLPDLTRPYHNLLSVTRNDGSPAQTFYWDSNTAAMEENGTFHYYLQDEMGSPVRISGYDGTDSMADGNHGAIDTYLTYGYDEFGNDLARTTGKELEEAGIPSPYTMQGEGQPFGYTGYRYDTLGATYFAQAREYDPQTGRFHAQDVIAGNGAVPVTLNRYGYCLGNPVGMVDLDGREPEYNFEIFPLLPDSDIQTDPDVSPLFEIPMSPQNGGYQNEEEIFDNFPFIIDPDLTDKDLPQNGNTKNGIKSGEWIGPLDPNATYFSLNKDVPVIMVSVEFGAGLYGEIFGESIPSSMGAELGIKDYIAIESTNWSQPIFGYYGGGSFEIIKLKTEIGYEYEEYIRMNYVRQEGIVRQLFVSNEDTIIGFGGSFYAGIGGGASINFNLSELGRRMETKLDELKKWCGLGD